MSERNELDYPWQLAAALVVMVVFACWLLAAYVSAVQPEKPPSELILASPDGLTTITLRAADMGASFRMVRKADGKEIKASITVDDRTGQLCFGDDKGDVPVAADDLRRAYQALGR